MSAKATFDSKDFNSEAFGIYSGLVAPDLNKNELIASAAFTPSQEVRNIFQAHPERSSRQSHCTGFSMGSQITMTERQTFLLVKQPR